MIPALFLTPLFKIGATALVALVLVGSCMLRDASLKNQGAAQVVSASKEQGKKINAKNETVRRRAAEPGAAERLLKDDCRDCR